MQFRNANTAAVNYIEMVKNKILFQAMLPNVLWGFGFTATIWALRGFTLTQILFLRFALVGFCGLFWCLFKNRTMLRKLLPLTLLPSLFLLTEVLFQVWGLNFTTATNAGFLTVTYVVMVPLIEKYFRGKSIQRSHWIWVLMSLLGTAIMVRLQDFAVNIGDLLMLISALGASLHLVATEKLIAQTSNLFIANTMQSLWGAVILFPVLIFKNEPWIFNASILPWIGIVSLVFGSTMLAFYFQMRAQVHLSPTVSSLLFLVESPLAAIFGFLLLNETMSLIQWLGGLLILVAAAGVIRQNSKNTKA